MGRGWMHPGCSRSWDVGWLLAGPGNARHTANSPGEQMLSSQCFLLFPIKFLFSRPEAITFACVFFQESQRSRNSLERLGQPVGFVGGFFFLFVVVLVVVQTILGSRAGTQLPTSLLHEHPAPAPPARNTSTRTPPGAPTPFGKSSSGFETAEADFQGKAVQSCIDPITWFYLNSLAEIIHLR